MPVMKCHRLFRPIYSTACELSMRSASRTTSVGMSEVVYDHDSEVDFLDGEVPIIRK